MLGNTPMMQQYQQIKQNYPDTLLFFRLGDFYEMFGPDAELAAKELQITLTGREAGLEERVPMCGVPYHAVNTYLSRLIQKGYKVAICEQVEDPKTAKGIVKREVIRVITPGTAYDGQLITDQARNYLAGLICDGQGWGLAYGDFSTGEFWVTEFIGVNAVSNLKDEIARINPAEIILPNSLRDSLPSFLKSFTLTYLDDNVFAYAEAANMFSRHFAPGSWETSDLRASRTCVRCSGAILSYLQDTQKAAPLQILHFQRYSPECFLMIDATTFRNLEIIRTLRSNERKGSLFDCLDKTKTAQGSRLLRVWLEQPLTEKMPIEDRYDAAEELIKNWSVRQTIRKCLDEVYDFERIMTRILYSRATPHELLSLRNSLSVIPEIKSSLANLVNSSYIIRLTAELDTLDDIKTIIDQAIEENAPTNLNNGGVIKRDFDMEVSRLWTIRENGRQWIAQLEAKEKESSGIKSLKIGYNKVFGYYFEITKSNLASVPEYFRRKQTLANGERYVTEELVTLESQVLSAEEKLLSLESKLYADILTQIGAQITRIQSTTRILAQIDVLQSMAEVAVKNNYSRPILLEKNHNSLSFHDLRHPVVEKLLTASSFVPNNFSVSADTNLSIITGPNMGGKSTFCRSVALAVLMAQAGSFVPAKLAEISLRDKIFARVGASDDLGSGQSTFMVEMNEVANILKNATPFSLVILDEVGRGTSTYDGLSMAWAVSEYLLESLQSKTLFATHYHELTHLEKMFPGIQNLSVSVREKGEEIIFLHKIVVGPADKSYGIQVGRLAGLPAHVIQRAKEILRVLEKDKLDQTKIHPHDDSINEAIIINNFSEQEEECLQQLKKLELDQTTPLEALNILVSIQRQLKE